MAAQHSPGPWEFLDDDEVVPGVPCIPIEAPNEDGGDHPICDVSSQLADDDETFVLTDRDRANARLICAAPDLLIQLKGLLGLARFLINAADVDVERTKCVLRQDGEAVAEVPIATVLQNSEAAILKVTGAPR